MSRRLGIAREVRSLAWETLTDGTRRTLGAFAGVLLGWHVAGALVRRLEAR